MANRRHPLPPGRRARGEILNFLDDHSRLLLACVAFPRVTGPAVVDTFRTAIAHHGVPASVLSDNGMVFTTRFAGGRGGRAATPAPGSRPNPPAGASSRRTPLRTTRRPAGRSNACTRPRRSGYRPTRPARHDRRTTGPARPFPIPYNTSRPHRALNRAHPATAYLARRRPPPPAPGPPPEARVRRDRIDNSGVVTLRHDGRLHHIGIGRTHDRTYVLLLIQDRDIRVIHDAPANSCANSPSTPPATTNP